MMRKAIFILIVSLLALKSESQECIDYVLHFQSNVTAGGPSAIFYNITGAGLTVGSGSASFDMNNGEQIDTLCMTAGCNLSITIDASTWPADNSFDFQIWALGAPLQFANYNTENGLIQTTFCCTMPCPSQVQSQMLDCDSYSFYVDASFGNVSWDFGDTSNDPIGNYQLHNYTENGFFNVLATVDAPGCGPAYILNVPININCDTSLNCPSALVIESLTCQDYYIHFDLPVPGLVEWQIDGVPLNTGFSEITVNWENGLHEVIAIYLPTGQEGCPQNLPITFWDTLTVACEICQPVFMGFSSVLELGGTEMLMYSITNENGVVVNQGAIDFTLDQPVFDFYDCWSDGCYYLDICSEGPVADSNFFVDAIAPLVVISDEQYTSGLCNGRLLQLGLNNNCEPPACDGEWLTLSVDAAYLTVPPFFSPDTLYWNVVSINGVELAQGTMHVNDAWPSVSDSVCMPLPLTCYSLNTWLDESNWGATYLDYQWNLADSVITGQLSPMDYTHWDTFEIETGSCFVNVQENLSDGNIVYPNPFDGYIVLPNAIATYQLISLSGQVVLIGENAEALRIDTSTVPSGFWMLKTTTKTGLVSTQRIVKL